jgi:hypothetical protein
MPARRRATVREWVLGVGILILNFRIVSRHDTDEGKETKRNGSSLELRGLPYVAGERQLRDETNYLTRIC